MDTNTFLDIDRYMLLSLNGSDSIFWDGCMKVYTSMGIWMPLAVVLVYVLIKNNNIKDFFLLVVMIGIVFGLTDFISSGLCKPFFERWRPTRDPLLMYIVDVVNETRGKDYGFTSSHASHDTAVIRDNIAKSVNIFFIIISNYLTILSLILLQSISMVHTPGLSGLHFQSSPWKRMPCHPFVGSACHSVGW